MPYVLEAKPAAMFQVTHYGPPKSVPVVPSKSRPTEVLTGDLATQSDLRLARGQAVPRGLLRAPPPSHASLERAICGNHYLAQNNAGRDTFMRHGLDVPKNTKGRDYVAPRIAIAGAGLAGCAMAVMAGRRGYDVTLFEKAQHILSSGASRIPAHLYSGAFYFDQGPATVRECMEDSVLFARLLAPAINRRPTIGALHESDQMPMRGPNGERLGRRTPADMVAACEANQKLYSKLVVADPRNRVFGDPASYFKAYERADVQRLLDDPSLATPKGQVPRSNDAWVRAWAEHANLDSLQWPIVIVHEYGINMRRAAGALGHALEELEDAGNVTVATGHAIEQMHPGYVVSDGQPFSYDWCVNAAGVGAGQIDQRSQRVLPRSSDVKLAGVFTLPESLGYLPEVYIMGNPMSHYSPIDDKHFVANVTAKDATYLPGGAVFSGDERSDATLDPLREGLLESSPAMEDETKSRLDAMKRHWRERFPALGDAIPVRGIGGSVEVLGRDSTSRSHNDLFYYRDGGLLCVSLQKGGASLSAAKALSTVLTKDALSAGGSGVPPCDVGRFDVWPDDATIEKRAKGVAEHLSLPADTAKRFPS